jgi:trehalose utilization protein
MSKLLLLLTFLLACTVNAAPIRVVVWDEQSAAAKKVYTNSIGDHIADYLRTLPGLSVKSVSLADPDQGLSPDTINNCDVLIWWSHTKNRAVPDDKVNQIVSALRTAHCHSSRCTPRSHPKCSLNP